MRLIDADVLLEEFEKSCGDGGWWFESRVENAPTVNPWISVDDRLPCENKSVLVFTGEEWDTFEFKTIAYLANDGEWRGSCCGKHIDVTHWMDLPEPPSLD